MLSGGLVHAQHQAHDRDDACNLNQQRANDTALPIAKFSVLPHGGQNDPASLNKPNDSTLPGWSLFVSNGNPPPTYAIDTGSSNGGAFKSLGASGNTDRALGGVGSSGTYFGDLALEIRIP